MFEKCLTDGSLQDIGGEISNLNSLNINFDEESLDQPRVVAHLNPLLNQISPLPLNKKLNLSQELEIQPHLNSLGLPLQNLNFVFSDQTPDLKSLKDEELEFRVELFFKSEKKLNKNLLDHLAEMDCRELYLKAGYQSFYEYLNIRFQVDGGSAQRRIDATRLIQKIPQVSQKIRDGSLSLNKSESFNRR